MRNEAGSGVRSRLRGTLGTLLTVGLAVALLAGCSEDQPGTADTFEYAALGDSFTAAPWLRTTSTDGCARSDRNYPHLVAEELGDVRLIDVSCGGATTADLITSQEQTSGRVHPPQIEALSQDTDLVTVGIGANDLDASFTTIYQCVQLAKRDPRGSPCTDRYAEQMPRTIDQIEDNVVEALEAVARRAPDARTLLVGYPRLLPPEGGCPDQLPIATGDLGYVRQSVQRISQALEDAADRAGVDYIDVYAASAGHDICSEDPWVNGPRKDPKTKAAPYHPTPAHQQAVADLVLDAL